MDTMILLQSIVNGLMMGGVYSLVAVGLTLIFGVMNVVNFAHGEFVMLGMVLTYLLHHFLGWDPLLSLLLIILIIIVMLGAGALVQKTLISRVIGQPDEAQILLTLGLSVLLINLVLLFMGPHYLWRRLPTDSPWWPWAPCCFRFPVSSPSPWAWPFRGACGCS